MLTRPSPLHIVRGEAWDTTLTLVVKATGDPLDPWPDSIRGVMSRGAVDVEFSESDDSDTGVVVFSLTADQTADLDGDLWSGGFEVDGRTWLRFSVLVAKDPTP